jgi:hypothetical protein
MPIAVIETSPTPPRSAEDAGATVLSVISTAGGINADIETDHASRRLWMDDCDLLGPLDAACRCGGDDRFVSRRGFESERVRSASFRVCGSGLDTLVNPQKITLTCRLAKIALLACDVGIPFAADRHSAPTPCRSSRKPRGVVMAHAVRKDTAPRRPSRSAKDSQTRPADAIHKYVNAPLIGIRSKMARCLLPGD